MRTRHIEPPAGGARRLAGGSAWASLSTRRDRRRRPAVSIAARARCRRVLGQATQSAFASRWRGAFGKSSSRSNGCGGFRISSDRRLIAVNIPMFRLWAWSRDPPGRRPLVQHGCDRRPCAQHPDAGVRRPDALHHLPAVLECSCIYRARRSAGPQARSGLPAPAGYGDRVRPGR